MSRKIPPCTAIGPNPCFFGRIIWLEDAANRGACFPAPLPPLRKVGHRMAGAAPPAAGRFSAKKWRSRGACLPSGAVRRARPARRGPTSPGRRRIPPDAVKPIRMVTAIPCAGGMPHRRTRRTRTQRPLPRGRAVLRKKMAVEGNVFTLRGCAASPRGRAGRDGSPPAAGQRCVTGRPGNPRGSGRCAPSARPCPPPSPRKTARHTAARPAPWPLRWPPAGGGIWRACPTWSPQA